MLGDGSAGCVRNIRTGIAAGVCILNLRALAASREHSVSTGREKISRRGAEARRWGDGEERGGKEEPLLGEGSAVGDS